MVVLCAFDAVDAKANNAAATNAPVHLSNIILFLATFAFSFRSCSSYEVRHAKDVMAITKIRFVRPSLHVFYNSQHLFSWFPSRLFVIRITAI
jgi:hypothetical protein